MKAKILIGLIILLLSSCSSANKGPKQLSEKARVTISKFDKLQKGKIIDNTVFQKAKENIEKYDKKGFFGKYWLGAVFTYVLLASFIYSFIEYGNDDRAKPLSLSKSYLIFLIAGFSGGHCSLLFLRKNKGENKIFKYCWLLLIFILFFLNYTAIMYFYQTPSLLKWYWYTWSWSFPNSYFLCYSYYIVCALLFMYLFSGLLLPYNVYKYNACYFRIHYENNDILNGKSTSAGLFCKDLPKEFKAINKDLKDINKYVKGDYSIPDPDRDESFTGGFKRFIKKIVTLGNSSKLEKEIDRLRMLMECCQSLSEDIKTIDNLNSELYNHLSNARIAVYRNLYLSKELLGIVKNKISSEQQKLLVDDFMNIDRKESLPLNGNFRAGDVSFNSLAFYNNFGANFESISNGLSRKLDKVGVLSKEDYISAGLELGIETAINSISNVIDLYHDTKEARIEVQKQTSVALNYIKKTIPSIQNYQASLLRQCEILVALTNCNKAFVMAYEPLRKQVFGEPTFWKFLTGIKKRQKLFGTSEFREELQHLILVCSEYNKINKSKI